MAYLDITFSEGRRRVPLGDEAVTIGRHQNNRLTLHDDRTSRFHAVLEPTPKGYRLRDLGSSNGTYCNEEKVDVRMLEPGDVFRVGGVYFRFVDESSDADAEAAEDGQASGRAGTSADGGADRGRTRGEARSSAKARSRSRSRSERGEASSGWSQEEAPISTQPISLDDPRPARGDESGLSGDSHGGDSHGGGGGGEGAAKRGGVGASRHERDGADSDDPRTPIALEGEDDWSDPSGPGGAIPEEGSGSSGKAGAGEFDPFAAAASDEDEANLAFENLGESDRDPVEKLRELAYKVGEDEAAIDENAISLLSARGKMVHEGVSQGSETGDDETIRFLRLLLLACVRTRATDLHLEPKSTNWVVRLRVDGTMVEAVELSQGQGVKLASLVKILADIDISQKSVIQEGHFTASAPGRRVDYRVSFTPSMYGQKLVLRVLDPSNAPQHTRDLNLPDWMAGKVRRVAKQDAGMVLVCGPTGSGKTTTLYAVLRDVDVSLRNVITIEDPVEYYVEGVTQIPIDERQGNTFHTLLRSVLRQDPDVILLGEVRDQETAQTAMQAAMTGHLVLSTTHAKDTLGAIFRVLDLEVEPYLVASALHVVIAQRLVRLLCEHCKVARTPTPGQSMRLGASVDGLSKIYFPGGCERCLHTGFMGRAAIFELLETTDDLRDVIINKPTLATMRQALRTTMFQTLREAGNQYVRQGRTSIEEIERVTGGGD